MGSLQPRLECPEVEWSVYKEVYGRGRSERWVLHIRIPNEDVTVSAEPEGVSIRARWADGRFDRPRVIHE